MVDYPAGDVEIQVANPAPGDGVPMAVVPEGLLLNAALAPAARLCGLLYVWHAARDRNIDRRQIAAEMGLSIAGLPRLEQQLMNAGYLRIEDQDGEPFYTVAVDASLGH